MLNLILTLDSALGEEHDRLVGTLTITNTADHPQSPKYGNYRAVLRDGENPAVRVRIKNWERDRNAWELVEETLRAVREREERKEHGPVSEIPIGEWVDDLPEVFKTMFGITE